MLNIPFKLTFHLNLFIWTERWFNYDWFNLIVVWDFLHEMYFQFSCLMTLTTTTTTRRHGDSVRTSTEDTLPITYLINIWLQFSFFFLWIWPTFTINLMSNQTTARRLSSFDLREIGRHLASSTRLREVNAVEICWYTQTLNAVLLEWLLVRSPKCSREFRIRIRLNFDSRWGPSIIHQIKMIFVSRITYCAYHVSMFLYTCDVLARHMTNGTVSHVEISNKF